MNLALKPLAEQVVLITGASSGIGLATARLAARRGAKVMLVSRNADALARIVDGIRLDGGIADHAVADVGDRVALAAAADKAIERFGRIDSWINNAGVAIYAKLLDTPEDEHRRLFQTNYFGVVHGCEIAVGHLQARGGALITVASVAGEMPMPIMGAYVASKHAVVGYMESLRIELEMDRLPIAISIIKPAGAATPIGIHAANHLDGEALVPPPAYDPALVAEAILACTEQQHDSMTVGGVGRADVLFAGGFPRLFKWLSPLIIPFLTSRSTPKTCSNNLATPAPDGDERSPDAHGMSISPYTTLQLYPRTAAAAIGVGLLGAAMVWRHRRRRGG